MHDHKMEKKALTDTKRNQVVPGRISEPNQIGLWMLPDHTKEVNTTPG